MKLLLDQTFDLESENYTQINSKFGLCEAKPNRREQSDRFDGGAPLPKGKGDDEDRFGKAVASPNVKNF